MATNTLNSAAFWDGHTPGGPETFFPSEFPYEIDSPVDSSLSPTESEAEEDVEEYFLAELTRRLTRSLTPVEPQKLAGAQQSFSGAKSEKLWSVSGSPKSTLSHGGVISANDSPTGGSSGHSPPTTPFGVRVEEPNWDLIYAAAGQVARMRLSGEGAKAQPRPQHRHVGGPLCPIDSQGSVAFANKIPQYGFCSAHTVSKSHSQTNQSARDEQMVKSGSPIWARNAKMDSYYHQYQQIQSRSRGVGYESSNGRCGVAQPLGLPQSAWPSLHAGDALPNQNVPNSRAVFLNSSCNMNKERAGTGVFLPRRFDNPAPEPRKKSGSAVIVPAKVVQALNLNLDDINARSQQYFTTDHDILARRNMLFTQQKRNLRASVPVANEVRLPQEWTY